MYYPGVHVVYFEILVNMWGNLSFNPTVLQSMLSKTG